MLTPNSKDPNRKDELKRKKANPEAFGNTKIGAAQSASPDNTDFADYRANLKAARSDVIEANEMLSIADVNYNVAAEDDAKPAEIKKLKAAYEEAELLANSAADVLNALIEE